MTVSVAWLDDPARHLYVPECGTEHGPCWACGWPEVEHHGRVDEAQASIERWRRDRDGAVS